MAVINRQHNTVQFKVVDNCLNQISQVNSKVSPARDSVKWHINRSPVTAMEEMEVKTQNQAMDTAVDMAKRKDTKIWLTMSCIVSFTIFKKINYIRKCKNVQMIVFLSSLVQQIIIASASRQYSAINWWENIFFSYMFIRN